MYYDIASLNAPYRGIERSITHNDFSEIKTKESFGKVISAYFEYIELLECPQSKDTFDKLVQCYFLFRSYNIACEVIVYDSNPLSEAFGYDIKFLGIDVVHDLAESLIACKSGFDDKISSIFNRNGLCPDLNNIDSVVRNGDHGDVDWNPCWVYRVDI